MPLFLEILLPPEALKATKTPFPPEAPNTMKPPPPDLLILRRPQLPASRKRRDTKSDTRRDSPRGSSKTPATADPRRAVRMAGLRGGYRQFGCTRLTHPFYRQLKAVPVWRVFCRKQSVRKIRPGTEACNAADADVKTWEQRVLQKRPWRPPQDRFEETACSLVASKTPTYEPAPITSD